jgi:hypothetical protein
MADLGIFPPAQNEELPQRREGGSMTKKKMKGGFEILHLRCWLVVEKTLVETELWHVRDVK